MRIARSQGLDRRSFVRAAVGLAAAVAGRAETAGPRPARIVDTHVHFFDPSRPQGVPWPPKDDALLYRTTLPKDYRALPVPQAVDGVVVVEASPWAEDNQWVLDLAAREPLIVGVVGNLMPGAPDFGAHLERFAANRLFRGFRIRDGSFERLLGEKAFVDDLKAAAERGLCFDVHSPPAWVGQAERLARLVPDLRLVINHVANARVDGRPPSDDWRRTMEGLAARPRVYMKVSGLVEGTGRKSGDAPADPELYRPVLEALWTLFGPDRLLYASNWPVSARFAPLARVQQIAANFFAAKGRAALDKVFWRSARIAYGLRAEEGAGGGENGGAVNSEQ